MDYRIDINTLALDTLRHFKQDNAKHLARIIDSFAVNPYPSRAQCLHEPADIWRIHEGHCRIAYAVRGDRVLILAIHTAEDRKDFYKKIKQLITAK